jgi:hypothetical protein
MKNIYDIIVTENDEQKWELLSTYSFNEAIEVASEHFANTGTIVQIFKSGKLEAQFGF